MSGICGIIDIGREINANAVTRMAEELALPGEKGAKLTGNHHARLGVAQRWRFQDAAQVGDVSIVVDADLVDCSVHRPETDSYAEPSVAAFVARLYADRGLDFLQVLRGAFSVALWDERKRRLVLAIDRMGIKSLYWRREGDRVLFASHIRAIRAVQNAPAEVNPTAILQFLLFSAVPAPFAVDKGVEKLRPGTFLISQDGRVSEQTYWDLEYPESKDRDVQRWACDLRESLRSAVHRHLEGSDPEQTGCYLSGGTDSSSMVAFTSEKHKPAQSFSIAFEEAGFSEIDYARTAANCFHTRHHEKWVKPQDAVSALDKIVDFYDEPFANSSAIGSYYCAVMAREAGVETLLAGDGGDELFGGNERYAHDKRFALYHELPTWLRRGLIEPIAAILPEKGGKLSLLRKYVRRANIPNPRRILSYGFFLSFPPEEIFDPGFLDKVGTGNWLSVPEGHFQRARATSELNRILYLDLKMTLADNDLRKVSGTAELAGVNVRYPLLDDRLAEFSGRIPASLKLRGFEKRYIFKQAMKGILPDKVLYKKKHGFGVPLAQWLLRNAGMRELVQDLMEDRKTQQRGYFQPAFVKRLMSLHREQPNFYGEIVWYLVALELWHRRHLENKRDTVHAA